MYDQLKQLAGSRQIILGSGSPRRVKLLEEVGISFSQIVPDIEEDGQDGESPFACAKRLAEEKALSVSKTVSENEIVIGCDTVVILEGRILGKPNNEQEAFETLLTLSGKTHTVCTAVALADRTGLLDSRYETTEVSFNSALPDQIREYIDTGEPMDKAGAYGIQGMGAFLVDRIEGNLDTVIGLPRTLLDELAATVNRRLENNA